MKKHLNEYKHFNPRSRAGSDYDGKEGCQQALISIHAPVRGAT